MKRIAAQLAAAIPLLVLHGALGFLALIAYVTVTAGVSIADTSKTRATEARVNGIVTQLGTTNSNVTAAQTTANNALPKSGGTISGNLTVTGSVTVDTNLGVQGGTTLVGDSSCSGNWTSGGSTTVDTNLGVHGNVSITNGQTLSVSGGIMPQSEPGGVSSPPNGTGGTSQYAGNFYTGSGASSWAIAITNAHNSLLTTLVNAGVLN